VAEVVALLPAENAPHLRTGQPVEVTLAGQDAPLAGQVVAVAATPLAPADARAQVGLPGNAALPKPVVAVRVAIDDTDGLDAGRWRGAAAEVRVAVGARSGLAVLAGGGLLSAAGEK
jgi:hypothetical protein